jgi:ribosome-associated translation inhibitor RaiA
MRLDIQGSALSRQAEIRRYIERKALLEFGRFGDRIDTLRVRVIERPNEPRGRFFCGLAVTIAPDEDGLQPRHVLARRQDEDPRAAIDAVIERAGQTTAGELVRADAARAAREQWKPALAGAGAGS